jgi:carbamate kinase
LSTERKIVVIALGGNAILQPGQVGTFEEQLVNVDAAARRIARLVPAGWQVVMTHGNGPQVGNILIQNEASSTTYAACGVRSPSARC